MSRPPNPVDELFKMFEKTVLDPIKITLNLQGKPKPEKSTESLLPISKNAVFWDYENFPFPSNIPASILLESLFPGGHDIRYVTKRVYGKSGVFNTQVRTLFSHHEFEIKEVIDTGKKNQADLRMTSE